MTPAGGAGEVAVARMLESIRAAAHAAVDAGDRDAAVELVRLLEQRGAAAQDAPAVVSLLLARHRRPRRRK